MFPLTYYENKNVGFEAWRRLNSSELSSAGQSPRVEVIFNKLPQVLVQNVLWSQVYSI